VAHCIKSSRASSSSSSRFLFSILFVCLAFVFVSVIFCLFLSSLLSNEGSGWGYKCTDGSDVHRHTVQGIPCGGGQNKTRYNKAPDPGYKGKRDDDEAKSGRPPLLVGLVEQLFLPSSFSSTRLQCTSLLGNSTSFQTSPCSRDVCVNVCGIGWWALDTGGQAIRLCFYVCAKWKRGGSSS